MGYDTLVGDDSLVGDDDFAGAVLYSGDDDYAGADADVAALMAGDDDYAGDAIVGDAIVGFDASGAAVHRSGRRSRPRVRGGRGLGRAQLAAVNAAAMQQARAAQFARREQQFVMQRGQPMLVRQTSPDRKLKLPAGFSALAVAAGGTATIQVEPQCLFRADELVIPEAYGTAFVITELAIGQTRLIVGSAPVPALAFSEKTLRPIGLDWPTNQTTQKILMIVSNITLAVASLYGMFFGRAAT